MFLLVSRAVAGPEWDCDSESFTSVEEMRPWYDGIEYNPSYSLDVKFASWRDSLLDASCVPVDCSYTHDELLDMGFWGSHACQRYACITSAGAAIAWSREAWTTTDYVTSITETEERWSVALPDGTSVMVEGHDDDQWDIMLNGYSSSVGQTVTWVGTPFTDLPADSTYTANTSYSTDDWGNESHGYSWSSGSCSVHATFSYDEWGIDRSVDVGEHEGRVDYKVAPCRNGFTAYLDDTLVGAVDGTSWARLASDADGDGVEVGADCDDADASVSPCASDHSVDGIDQDCDGTDGS